jgi:hypothetical protein
MPITSFKSGTKSRSMLVGNLGYGFVPVAGYKLWLDATDSATITASGGAVSQWNDKSGNASNFTQGTGANQPTTGTRTINSKNVIDFDGTNDFLSCPSSTGLFKYLHTTTGGTTFVVAVVDDSAGDKGLFASSQFASAQIGAVLQINGTERTDIAIVRGESGVVTALVTDLTTLTVGSPFYLTNKFDGGNATAANRLKESLNGGVFNGSNAATNAASSSNSTYDMAVGSLGSGSSVFNGGIGEVIFYEGILSNGDIALVQSYLATKWGI